MSSSSLELLWLSVCFAGLSSSFASSGSNNQGQFLSSLRSVAIPGHCLQLRVVCFTPDLLGNSTPFIFYPAIGWTFSTQVFTVFSSLATVSTWNSPPVPVIKPQKCSCRQLFLVSTDIALVTVATFVFLLISSHLQVYCSCIRLLACQLLLSWNCSFSEFSISTSLDCVCFFATSVNCSRLHFASTSVTVCTVPVFTSTQALFWLNFSTVKHSSFTNLHRPFVGRPQRASTVYQQVTFLSLSFILLCSIYYIILYFTLCPIWYISCLFFFENPTVIHSHL